MPGPTALSAKEQVEFARMLAGEFKNPAPDAYRRSRGPRNPKKPAGQLQPAGKPSPAIRPGPPKGASPEGPSAAHSLSQYTAPGFPNRARRYDSAGRILRPPPDPKQFDTAAINFMNNISSPSTAPVAKHIAMAEQVKPTVTASTTLAPEQSPAPAGASSMKEKENKPMPSVGTAAAGASPNANSQGKKGQYEVPVPGTLNTVSPGPLPSRKSGRENEEETLISFDAVEDSPASKGKGKGNQTQSLELISTTLPSSNSINTAFQPRSDHVDSRKNASEMDFTQDLFQFIIQSNPIIKEAISGKDEHEMGQGWSDVDFLDEEDVPSRIESMTLLDFAEQVFPEIQALSPTKKNGCKCREEHRRYYGLENSKYSDRRDDEQPKDLREKATEKAVDIVRKGVKEGTRYSTQRLAAQLLSLEHNLDCPYTQVVADQYPLFFGANPAVTRHGDDGSDDGLEVIPSKERQLDAARTNGRQAAELRREASTVPRNAKNGSVDEGIDKITWRMRRASLSSSETDKALQETSRPGPSQRLAVDAPQLLNVSGTRGIKGGLKNSRWA